MDVDVGSDQFQVIFVEALVGDEEVSPLAGRRSASSSAHLYVV